MRYLHLHIASQPNQSQPERPLKGQQPVMPSSIEPSSSAVAGPMTRSPPSRSAAGVPSGVVPGGGAAPLWAPPYDPQSRLGLRSAVPSSLAAVAPGSSAVARPMPPSRRAEQRRAEHLLCGSSLWPAVPHQGLQPAVPSRACDQSRIGAGGRRRCSGCDVSLPFGAEISHTSQTHAHCRGIIRYAHKSQQSS